MIRVALVLICAWIAFNAGDHARAASDRVALVIGNGKYLNANALPNPPNDARAVAKALGNIGFDVTQGQDLDRIGMERLVRDFLHKAAASRVALLYYAGHGMQVDGRNYLVPIDARLEAASDLNYETIKLDDILDNLNDPGRASIVILDACRDNPLARSFASRIGATRSAAVSSGLAAYSTLGTGTLIAYSTAPGQVALDGQGTNSPFTTSLVKYLGTPGIEVRQMLTRVRASVAAATHNRQIPWDNSSLLGEVYLADAPAAPSEPQPAIANAAPAALAPMPSPPLVPTSAPPSAGDAAQAWAVTKDTTSIAVLQDFIRQFGKTPYGSMARARLKELQAAAKPQEQKTAAAVSGGAAPSKRGGTDIDSHEPPGTQQAVVVPNKRLTFQKPLMNGVAVDRCGKPFMAICDEPVATKWCREKGYSHATAWKMEKVPRAYRMMDASMCDTSTLDGMLGCEAFSEITCE